MLTLARVRYRAGRNLVLETDAVAYRLAYLFAQQLRHAFGNGAGR